MTVQLARGSLLLVLFATAALAGPTPRRDDEVAVILSKPCEPRTSGPIEMISAERAWCAAEAEANADLARPLWEVAAIAFDKALPSAGTEKATAAEAAVIAWGLALDSIATPQFPAATKPTPFSTQETAFLRSLDRYLKLATQGDIPGLLITRAQRYRLHRRFDEAVPSLVEVVTTYPGSEVAEFAANYLLEALDRQGKVDQRDEWVEKMRANKTLLKSREDLIQHLDALHLQKVRTQAEMAEAAGARDPSAYMRCAQLYVDEVTANPRYEHRDELLFKAASCYERAGAIADAARTFQAVVKVPRSRLAAEARSRAAKLLPRTAPAPK